MASDKTVAVSFRVSPRFKALLERAALRERRSQTNMVETLVFDYCARHGLDVAKAPAAGKRAKKSIK
jgi:predicted transcriptional regulator